MHKSYAAAAARKPHAAPPTKSAAPAPSSSSNGATNGKKKCVRALLADANAKPNGKDAAAPPGFAAPKRQTSAGFSDQHQRVLRHRALFAFRFLVAFESGSSVVFKRRQIAHLAVDGTVSYNESALGAAAAAGFRTDTEISGRQHEHLIGRELQAASSWLDPQLDSGGLEDPRRRGSAAAKAGWNQFEANEKLFGVVSTFDENIYTTKLDKSKISTQQSREAERIALEIERQTSSNFHLQEERGHAAPADDLDEEARYSSVDRKHTKVHGATMPALRNAQRQAKPAAPASAAASATDAPTTAVATAAAAPPAAGATATPAPKPLSFSDAVTGRTQATKPEQKKTTATGGGGAAAATTSDSKVKADTKVAPVAAAAAPASPEKKTPATKEPAKEPAKATATKEAKAKADASPMKKTGKSAASVPPAPAPAPAPASTTAPVPAPAKKGLNPNAKEFKFNVAAAEFTPKFAPPPVTSSPYRGAQSQQPHHHHHSHQQQQQPQHHHPHPQHMGHLHHQPHPAMMYSPMPEEWMYDGAMGLEDPEMLAQGYLPYGVPLVPGAVMQPQVYAPPPHMIPQQNLRMMGGGDQRQHGGYGYQQPYSARGYYPPTGAVPGGVPYPGAVPVGVAVPQPPLPPREPSPHEAAGRSAAPPASPSLQPQQSAGKPSAKK
ncbi:hypothetical protein PybrP1_005797 [[Pythium] brassicae (nom. inval.)]|nr:hypothetical protein PybrP1_005797 [[Pythium] brassicae (nom. inval.)]